MWRSFPFRAAAFWIAFAALRVPVSQVRGATAQNEDEQAIRLVEDQIEEATGKNDVDALSKLWASDYIFVNPAGQRLTRAQRLQMFRSGELRVENYKRDQESIRVYGTTAVVFYRSTVAAARSGTDISSQRRVTTVLVKRGGQWQAVSQQSSRIRGPANADSGAIGPIHEQIPPARGGAADDSEEKLREVEQQIADATGHNNADALERLWAPEYVWVGPVGLVLTRAQRLAMIRSGQVKPESYTIDEEEIRIYGATAVAIFRSTVVGAIDCKDVSSRRRVTNVLVKRDGRWQAVSQHSTVIEQP